jgi:hypothetical protein
MCQNKIYETKVGIGFGFKVDGDIPIDPDNPRRCIVCGKVFQNHFGVKTHYQNVHLKVHYLNSNSLASSHFPS